MKIKYNQLPDDLKQMMMDNLDDFFIDPFYALVLCDHCRNIGDTIWTVRNIAKAHRRNFINRMVVRDAIHSNCAHDAKITFDDAWKIRMN